MQLSRQFDEQRGHAALLMPSLFLPIQISQQVRKSHHSLRESFGNKSDFTMGQ